MPNPDPRRRSRGRASGTVAVLIALASILVLFLGLPAGAQVSASASDSATASATPSQDPSPTASPTQTTSPAPTSSTTSPTPPPSPSPTSGPTSDGGSWSIPPSQPGIRVHVTPNPGTTIDEKQRWKNWTPSGSGDYTTAVLDRAAERLRARGWTETKITREIYAPFIVEGPASWSDSWGAPRFVGGYHPHTGQDVLCRYGAPVLAVTSGTVSYATGSLGGLAAYLEAPDGSFWYYAHLSASSHRYANGDHIRRGEVLGRCGTSGDATVPHVHFSFVTANGYSVDPMPALVAWLRVAEHRLRVRQGETGEPVPAVPVLRAPTRTHTAEPQTQTQTQTDAANSATSSERSAIPPLVEASPLLVLGGVPLGLLTLLWAGRFSLRRVETGSRRTSRR